MTVKLYLPNWLAYAKGIGRRPVGIIKGKTDKAILFHTSSFPKLGSDRDKIAKEVWIPKSRINNMVEVDDDPPPPPEDGG